MNNLTKIEEHLLGLNDVQEQMRDFFARGQKVKIYHGGTNSTRAQKFEQDKFVDVSQLNRVIEVNTKERYALVEPNVSIDKLVEATMAHSLVTPVVMEFPGITVGGGIQGGAGESSSFKYGLFHETCLEYEIVLGNGEVTIASPTQNQDLFYGTACSYGSLGVITLVKLRLIPAKDFIHLTYHRVESFEESIGLTKKKVAEAKADFIDAIIFAKDRGVVMTGNFSDKINLPPVTFTKAKDEWFYIHADKVSCKHAVYEEIVPLRDYLFRYDRGAFWMGKYGFNFLKMPFNRLTRFLFNTYLKTRELYKSLHAANFSQRYLIQDIGVPQENAARFLDYVGTTLGIYPIWFIPIKPSKSEKLSLSYLQTDLVISVGIWGEINQDYSQFVKINRDLENMLAELSGRKWLYAHQYYPQGEFWDIYDQSWYLELRSKYHADKRFPDVYEKTVVKEKYKPSVLLGMQTSLRLPKIIR